MNTPYITVSYSGGEKRVGLCMQPSLELSDSEVEQVESELHKLLRRLFNVEPSVSFYLHEVETGRVMSRESFREPSYCQMFPPHWYMVMDSSSTGLLDGGFQYTNGPVHATEDLSRLGEVMSSLDLEESGLPSLADLTTDTKYQSFSVNGIGDSGCSLRYFSIQPTTSVHSDTTMDQSDSRSHSRSDSYVSSASADSLDALKLSTTFVGEVREGSLAAGAGVTRGFVVHMVNKDSILRASVDQIKLLVEQAGDEVTLLGLPQDNDDLQFLYSHYTTGEAGQFSTEDGFITVVDIPLILGTSSLSSSNGLSPPVGLVPFDANSGSQENSLSCDPFTLSSDKHGTDDLLIMGSLSEIGTTHEISKWDNPTSSSHQLGSSPNSAHHNGLGGGREWYQLEEEDEFCPPPNGGHDSSSGSTQNHSSQTPSHTPQSKQRHKKSLEALTRISSLDEEGAVMGHGDEKHCNTSQGNAKNWRSQSFNSSHGYPSSDNSQQSGGSVRGQGSAHPEEQRMSGDSVGSGNHESSLIRSTSSCSGSQATKGAPSGGRHAVRGYQARRKELHRATRSKNTLSEPELLLQSWGEKEAGTTEGEGNLDAAAADSKTTASPQRSRTSIPVIRHGSVKERTPENSPKLQVSAKPRPLSAIESQTNSALLAPGSTHKYNFRATDAGEQPLFSTVTALSPFGEQEVFREVNIGEAIARSQGNVLSCQDPSSNGGLERAVLSAGGTGGGRGRHMARHESMDSGSVLNATNSSGSLLGQGVPTEGSRSEIICHGLLSIKQDMTALGKKAQDRSWRNYYAVLAGTKITFYRDKRDAVLEKPSDEVPLEIVPAVVDLETKNTKRKFVFRLMTSLGQSYLLQADDAPNRQRWMELIKKQNAQQQASWQTKMVQLSPQSMRRFSSPQPAKSTGAGVGGGGGGGGLFGRLKRTLKRRDDTDYSSFTAFGQALKDCPVSPDNKRVPLVVEFCVGEVEEHGLIVEGIYRKPGLVAMINSMSAQMDKGNYMFDISDYGQDVHTVASLLKKFLKELPDALIPDHMYQDLVACARLTDEETRLNTLKDLVYHLPTAHYHTLKFLMRHLGKVVAHSQQNKMTLRNVALVFGPTLMRSSADGEEELLASMTAGYTIVELLCKHCEFLCSAELCAEEVETPPAPEQEDISTHPPSSRAEKEHALATASPQSVRRIKNRITINKDAALKRHSANPESYGSIPKLINHSGSATLGYSESSRGHLHASDSNISASTLQAEGEGPAGRKKPVRHMYEDVEIAQRDDTAKSSSRTINWINHHTEMNWGRGEGRGEESREMTGSMWSSRNRVPRQHSKEKLRNGSGSSGNLRRVVKTKSDQGRDALSTFQPAPPRHVRQPSAPNRGSEDRGHPEPNRGVIEGYHQASRGGDRGPSRGPDDRGPSRGPDDRGPSRGPDDRVPSRGPSRGPEDRAQARVNDGVVSSDQIATLKARRISYMSAMNEPSDIPVRDTSNPVVPSHRPGRDPSHRGNSPANTPQRSMFNTDYGMPYAGGRHGNSSRGYGAAQYSHFSAHPSLLQQRVGKYSTLQHDMTTPTNLPHRRQSSESIDPAEMTSRKPQQYLQQHSRGAVLGHRTFSNDRVTYSSHHSPPQRGDHVTHGTKPPPPRPAQVESYL